MFQIEELKSSQQVLSRLGSRIGKDLHFVCIIGDFLFCMTAVAVILPMSFNYSVAHLAELLQLPSTVGFKFLERYCLRKRTFKLLA